MTHPSLDNYPLDDDYLDVEQKPADITDSNVSGEQQESDSAASRSDAGELSESGDSVDPQQHDPQEHDPSRHTFVDYNQDYSYQFDRSDGAMSGTEIDVKYDRKPISDDDKRGGTRTGFNSNEGSGWWSETITREGRQYARAKWLRLIQNGYRSKERYLDNTLRDKETYLDVFTARLNMTTYQKQRVQMIIDSIDMSEMAHYPRELIILATISIVANEDDRWIRDEALFKELIHDLDATSNGVKNTRNLLRKKSPIL